jgi:hypothetical protein
MQTRFVETMLNSNNHEFDDASSQTVEVVPLTEIHSSPPQQKVCHLDWQYCQRPRQACLYLEEVFFGH